MFINIIHIKIYSLLRLEEVTSILSRAQRNLWYSEVFYPLSAPKSFFDNHMPQLYRHYCVSARKWASLVLNDSAQFNISLFSLAGSSTGPELCALCERHNPENSFYVITLIKLPRTHCKTNYTSIEVDFKEDQWPELFITFFMRGVRIS